MNDAADEPSRPTSAAQLQQASHGGNCRGPTSPRPNCSRPTSSRPSSPAAAFLVEISIPSDGKIGTMLVLDHVASTEQQILWDSALEGPVSAGPRSRPGVCGQAAGGRRLAANCSSAVARVRWRKAARDDGTGLTGGSALATASGGMQAITTTPISPDARPTSSQPPTERPLNPAMAAQMTPPITDQKKIQVSTAHARSYWTVRSGHRAATCSSVIGESICMNWPASLVLTTRAGVTAFAPTSP